MATIIVTSMIFFILIFFPIMWFCLRSFTKIFNHVLAKDHIWSYKTTEILLYFAHRY
jgi:hypothetical protein